MNRVEVDQSVLDNLFETQLGEWKISNYALDLGWERSRSIEIAYPAEVQFLALETEETNNVKTEKLGRLVTVETTSVEAETVPANGRYTVTDRVRDLRSTFFNRPRRKPPESYKNATRYLSISGGYGYDRPSFQPSKGGWTYVSGKAVDNNLEVERCHINLAVGVEHTLNDRVFLENEAEAEKLYRIVDVLQSLKVLNYSIEDYRARLEKR
jgi:hypothetical protein